MVVAPLPQSVRLQSLDILRGLACVLMAIDHVRVYSGLPAGGPTPGIFLTRWVTHFVAPAFAFLAGAAIWFLGKRLADSGMLRRFLVTRGLVLVVLEMTLIRLLWSGTIGFDFMLAGVIWMLGWCMVLLALFVGMPARRVLLLGLAIIAFQAVFALPTALMSDSWRGVFGPWWAFIYPSGTEAMLGINVLYVIVPWIGVMMAGYGFAPVLELPDQDRHRITRAVGVGMTIAFVLIAAIITWIAGPPGPSEDGSPTMPFWMRMLDQRKYPASPLFLLMTLGPLIALIPWAERAGDWWRRALIVFGRVPMMYYLLHLVVIHSAAIAVTLWLTGDAHSEWFYAAPYTQIPPEEHWSLWLLYLVWAVCVAILHPFCKRYLWRKATNPKRWMTYI